MTDRSQRAGIPWWPLALVLALHLLSTAGTWWITDHGEILAVAQNLSQTGRFDLAGLGAGWEDWNRIASARQATDTRFLPLSVLALTPFLAVDHAFGWHDPGRLRFAYLQGHFFVMLGLALLGRFAARVSDRPALAAFLVLLSGLNWPVWMIARRIGPEPVLFALLALFVTGGTVARAAVLVALPWVHATGPLLGLGALLWITVRRDPSMKVLVPAAIAGIATVTLFWNRPMHRGSLLGGYGAYAAGQGFSLRPTIEGVQFLLDFALWTLPLWIVSARAGRRATIESLAFALPLVAFLGLLSHPTLLPHPEGERRLAPVIAGWVAILASNRVEVAPQWRLGLPLLSIASGLAGLGRDFSVMVPTPLGVFSGPHLLLLRLAFVEGHAAFAAAVSLLLLTLAIVATRRTLACLREGDVL